MSPVSTRLHSLSVLALGIAILGIAAIALVSDSGAEPSPAGPDPALAAWPGWPYQATCGYMGFNPVSVFSGPAEAERGAGAPEAALRGMLVRNFPFPLPDHGWRLAARRHRKALFLYGRLGAEFESPDQLGDIELEHRDGRWRMRTSGSFCNMFTVWHGRDAGAWQLAPKQPPLSPATRRLQVVTGARCARNQEPPLVTPRFDEIAGKLVMTLLLKYQDSPGGICEPGLPPWPPVVVELPEPLGDRELYDGAFFPPVPAQRYEAPTVIPL
jgi:hypothetical protein